MLNETLRSLFTRDLNSFAHGELGKDRSQAISMLKTAAAKGSPWANWNLVMACGWDLDEYGAANHAAAIQDLKNFCDRATKAHYGYTSVRQ